MGHVDPLWKILLTSDQYLKPCTRQGYPLSLISWAQIDAVSIVVYRNPLRFLLTVCTVLAIPSAPLHHPVSLPLRLSYSNKSPRSILPSSADFAETTLVSTPCTTASALAPLLFRASPIDQILRPPSVPISEGEFERYTNVTFASSEARGASPLPPQSLFGHSLSRPSSTSTQPSNAVTYQQSQPLFHTRGASLNLPQNKYNISLPGLSALANAASATPSQQRCDL